MWWTKTLSSTFAGNPFPHWSHLITLAVGGLDIFAAAPLPLGLSPYEQF